MIYRLSNSYRKEIALGLISLFFIAGMGNAQARTFYNPGENYLQTGLTAIKRQGIFATGTDKKLPVFSGTHNTAGNDIIVNDNSLRIIRKKNHGNPGSAIITDSVADIPESAPDAGPGQPEMSAFKSVNSDNLVSLFSGDFSYNIPLLDVGGYPVNMFYNSGITMDQDASWVGLGWNINPGTVTRNMRGLPDDFDGSDEITKRYSVKADKTWGVSAGAGVKFAGFPLISGNLDVSLGISFNNKLGVALESGIHPSLSISSLNADKKTSGLSYGATAGADLNVNSRSGAVLTPSISFDITKHNGEDGNNKLSVGAGYSYSSRLGVTGMHLDASLTKSKTEEKKKMDDCGKVTTTYASREGTTAALSSSLSFIYPTVVPSINNAFTHKSYNLNFSMGTEIFGLNGHVRLSGFYTQNSIADEDKITTHPAYGILHYQDANNDENALLDFNRANDGVYTPNSPAIALPLYTYDVFSINGEGTGGVFRAYRGDLGFVHDAHVKTRDDAASLGLDLGFGNTTHGGVEMSYAYTPTEVGAWKINNLTGSVFNFQQSDNKFQSVYFKNPGEKAIPNSAYQAAIGDEDLVRLKLGNVSSATPMLLPSLVRYDALKNKTGEKILTAASTIRTERDKRTQVISFLTADEAERIGFDKRLTYYRPDDNNIFFNGGCNKIGLSYSYRYSADPLKNFAINGTSDRYRKKNHISEIDVLGTDGRKYVYGMPVYNIKQVDASFSIANGSNVTGRSTYTPAYTSDKNVDNAPAGDDNVNNANGRDNFMEQQETPAYAHSFLLTALLSPNYVDVGGDGITEDDIGDAVKFNYARSFKNFKWRTPVGGNSASYSEGLKTDDKDDKAHYVYGEREQWLLYSIESKNMVARFFTKADRHDCRSVKDINDASLDITSGPSRLDRISLYSKADLIKYNNLAKPIKTIIFFNSDYKLCKNMNGSGNSEPGYGKLTLDSIWITYNGNSKPKSRYIFYYPNDKNPDYTYNSNDRWGNYKPLTDEVDGLNNNPGTLTNADFPYAVQNKAKADKYAAAWTMNKIMLPSGGTINVDYEADDYAYVQNKRAADMVSILGFGTTDNPSAAALTDNHLHYGNNGIENDRIYIQLPAAVQGTTQNEKINYLKTRYFENATQIYMKLSVIMPSSPGLAGTELIPVYADIADIGLVNDNVAFVKVRPAPNGSTPMVQQSLQFIKQQLPGKAYPAYDVSEENTGKAIVIALASIATSVSALAIGDDNMLKANLRCSQVQTNNSFVRLSNPTLTKYGGGIRVKKVTIDDNWRYMSHHYSATYGQEYSYKTTEIINNQPVEISSGVASWEPSVGDDENPHKEIMSYTNHNKGGPYDFGAVELPIGEVFYPTPAVGYSKVQVLSIHRDTVKNLPTTQVTEFFTTRDFPFRSSCTQLNDPEANVPYAPKKILQLLKLDMKKAITQSQGFLVDMNDMNGKTKKQSTFSALDPVNPIAWSQYFYNVEKATDNTYKFNHSFATIDKPDGKIGSSLIGRDIELMADFRQHTSETITTNININFDFFFLGIFPIPLTNLLQPVIHEGTTYRSASLLKIVNHYGVLDSIVNVDKESMVSTKNLVYDAETGNPLLTRTNNEQNKPVYNFSYPASWVYSGMGAACQNIDVKYDHITFRKGRIEGTDVDMGLFESGDELYVLSEKDNGPMSQYPCDPVFYPLPKNQANKIWALNTGKVGSLTPEMFFIDQDGNPYTAMDVSLRIIRSGHRNMLDQTVGSITSRNYPVDLNNNLIFNDGTDIIQTSAATFKDHWRVDNAFYKRDFINTVVTTATTKKIDFNPTDYVSVHWGEKGGEENSRYTEKPDHLLLYKYLRGWDGRHHREDVRELSFLKYEFSNQSQSLPSGTNFYKAFLSLYSHTNVYFPVSSYPSANHPNLHGAFSSQDQDISAQVSSLSSAWYNTNDANSWYNTYLSNNSQVSPGIGLIPMASGNGAANYFNNGRIDVSLPVQQSIGSLLNSQNQLGLRLRLSNDDETPSHNGPIYTKIRCFWSPGAVQPGKGYYFALPVLSYYYYICGENNPVYNDPDNFDPYLNNLITCSTVSIPTTDCPSKFSLPRINPYLLGILGDWRIDTTYAYYGARKNADFNTTLDTRTAGGISNFQKFWKFADVNSDYMSRNFDAASVWVWNSTVTQYNRKGYEIENKDPLGRFNSGLYGYNQQLPVATANNARLSEIMFDGFEDHSYEGGSGCLFCKPHRSVHFDNADANIVSEQSHTGSYSLKVMPGSNISINAPVTDQATIDRAYSLRVKVDSSSYGNSWLSNNANGTGLQAIYYTYANHTLPLEPGATGSTQVYATTELPSLPLSNTTSGNGTVTDYFSVKWSGIFQVPSSGNYVFSGYAKNAFKIKINGVQVTNNNNWVNPTSANFAYTNQGFNWTMGQTINIEIDFYNTTESQQFQMACWLNGSYYIMPLSSFYPPSASVFNTVMNHWCADLGNIKATDNALTDTLSLIQGKKMLLSAWVKEVNNTAPQDCKCSSYVKNNIVISYTGNSSTISMLPAGNIIEGWQRYETVFIVPPDATAINIAMNNTSDAGSSGSLVYFDDVRIHPFNANMKSFVYHSSNLRLMAELDENNYASFYEYDNDGTLARVKKETLKGVKTITETRSAMQSSVPVQ